VALAQSGIRGWDTASAQARGRCVGRDHRRPAQRTACFHDAVKRIRSSSASARGARSITMSPSAAMLDARLRAYRRAPRHMNRTQLDFKRGVKVDRLHSWTEYRLGGVRGGGQVISRAPPRRRFGRWHGGDGDTDQAAEGTSSIRRSSPLEGRQYLRAGGGRPVLRLLALEARGGGSPRRGHALREGGAEALRALAQCAGSAIFATR